MTRLSPDDYARVRDLLSDPESDNEVQGYDPDALYQRRWNWPFVLAWVVSVVVWVWAGVEVWHAVQGGGR